VDTAADRAALSSLAATLQDVGGRVTELAERYGATPDSSIAAELFAAERSVTAATRALDRAARLLDEPPR